MSAHLTLAPSPPDARADAAVPLALELVDAVRRWKPREVQAIIDRADTDALLVVLAAMVDDERTLGELFAWMPPQHQPRRARQRRQLKPCGTHAAYNRHKDRGEPIDPLCEAEEIRYQARRAVARRAARDAVREDVAS